MVAFFKPLGQAALERFHFHQRRKNANVSNSCLEPLFYSRHRIDIVSISCQSRTGILRHENDMTVFIGRERGGSLGDALRDLELSGFIRKDIPFVPATGRERPRDARYRLSDNYLRFHLKYIDPVKERIRTGLIYEGQLSPEIERAETFDFIIPAKTLLETPSKL